MKLAIMVGKYKDIDTYESIDAIKKAGFNDLFLPWYNKENIFFMNKVVKYIKEKNLNIIFLHLAYKHINSIWKKGPFGWLLIEKYKRNISFCKKNNIPMVILHLTTGKRVPMYNQLGIKRLKKLVRYAEKSNIKIAFENNRFQGYLEYVFSNINSKNIGLCFDAGHYHVHFKDKFNFDFFKNNIFAVHLHDNNGSSDQHLYPFEGTINWEETLKKLKEAKYEGPITLEILYQKRYSNMSIQEFYSKSYLVAEKLSKIYDIFSK
ncbi:MAG TPA: sugar phosphate isomerase/epimerase family protein [Bacilli bacterium]|nr:sugar phosphate isomerase/epimerase family protein [Bacilli bacterium]